VTRVLMIDLSRRLGGADIRVCDVAQHLNTRVDLHVAVLASGDVRPRMEATGATVWPLARSPRDPRLLLDFVALMQKIKPDIVDAHNSQSHVWGLSAARIAGVARRIATVHSVYELSETGGLRPRLYAVYPVLLQGLATEAVAVCASVERYLRARGFRRRPIHTISNGISVRKEVGRPKRDRRAGRLRIAIVGRLVAVKGHETLFKAMSRLKGRLDQLECLVIGDGPERASLEDQAKSLGLQSNVLFLGHRADVLTLVGDCDVLCMPSLTEGLPYAALEAAMLGVPIVASAVGGLAEAFQPGETACLFPAGDAEALAQELFWCAMEPRAAESIGLAAMAHVREKFSLDTMIARTEALYLSGEMPPQRHISAQPSATGRSPGR
jgi:glycosyltransferase involved in cell wall biosynthesis